MKPISYINYQAGVYQRNFVSAFVHDGSGWVRAKQLYVHDGTDWRLVHEKFFSSVVDFSGTPVDIFPTGVYNLSIGQYVHDTFTTRLRKFNGTDFVLVSPDTRVTLTNGGTEIYVRGGTWGTFDGTTFTSLGTNATYAGFPKIAEYGGKYYTINGMALRPTNALMSLKPTAGSITYIDGPTSNNIDGTIIDYDGYIYIVTSRTSGFNNVRELYRYNGTWSGVLGTITQDNNFPIIELSASSAGVLFATEEGVCLYDFSTSHDLYQLSSFVENFSTLGTIKGCFQCSGELYIVMNNPVAVGRSSSAVLLWYDTRISKWTSIEELRATSTSFSSHQAYTTLLDTEFDLPVLLSSSGTSDYLLEIRTYSP
jgi:hypothetical protein